MGYCEDCGCRTDGRGICSNCQEELYIVENQGDCIDFPLSDEFQKKVKEQEKYIEDNRGADCYEKAIELLLEHIKELEK